MTLRVHSIGTGGRPGPSTSGRIAGWRRRLAVAGLALTAALSAVVFAPAAGAAAHASTSRVSTAEHVISYQGNGGIGAAPPVQRVVDGEDVTVTANTFTRERYVFTGWNTRSDLTGIDYEAGTVFTPTADVTLYAGWTHPIDVEVYTSANSQVFRTTDPERLGVYVGSAEDPWYPDVSDGWESPGTVEIRYRGTLIKSLEADPFGFTEMTIPTNLSLGRGQFTATFIPAAVGAKSVTSDPVGFTIARASTVTEVSLRQQTLSAADQKKFKVRSGMSVSVRVAGVGTRTAARGSVALTIGSKVTTLKLVNGTAKTALVPTAAGARTVVATYQPSLDWWVRSTGRSSITVR